MRPKHILASAIVTVLFVVAFSSPNVRAQCKSLVRSGCVPQMKPYIHDGSNQAVVMYDGEDAEVFKTIFAGQRYRLLICSEVTLPNVEFVVSDNRRNILFDNRKNGNVQVWDFISDASQQIKITIRIPKSQKQEKLVSGCVGVLFGVLAQ